MDVSIIIVNYNTKRITAECIDSIFKYTKGVAFEIILVDNASTDGSKEYFSHDTRIIYIYENVNHGFGRANNIGAKKAKGKYLFLLNSDTLFQNNALLYFVRYFEKNKDTNLGCVGTYLRDINGNTTHSGGKFPYFTEVICSLFGISKVQIDYVTGADIFMKKSLFDSTQGFDEDFFMYYEETFLQFLIYKKGFVNELISGPLIIHLEGQSQQKISNKKRIQINKSLFLFWDKVYSCRKSFFCKFSYTVLKIGVFFKSGFSYRENVELFSALIASLRKTDK